MKISFFLIVVSVVNIYATSIYSQTVTGRVADASDSPLPGVTVVVQGTTTGTVTNIDGQYSLSGVPADATLVFSFVGMRTEQVAVEGRSTINVTMVSSDVLLDEVVITALGISRVERTLTYAQQTVSAEDLVRTRDMNFLGSLSGQAAGLHIQQSASGAGGSTRVLLRGNKSLSGSSEPLFVIDGVPMTNRRISQPGMWGGEDGGDGMSQLNPDDIASISILRGSNAAALYGSQGANGVVLITTKKGEEGAIKVSLNSTTSFENVMARPQLQFNYGAVGTEMESWSYTPGSYNSTFVDEYFQTGTQLQNSISISGGTERTTAYFSFSNVTSEGIVPTNEYRRNNLAFRQSTKILDDRLTISSNVMLTDEHTQNRAPAGYYLNPLVGLYGFPRNMDWDEMKEYEYYRQDRNMMWQNWHVNDHFQSNPYWINNKQPLWDDTRRMIGNLTLNYALSEQFSFQVRGNLDYADHKRERQHAAGSNQTNVHSNGRWDYNKYNDELWYTDALLSFNDDFGDFSLTAMAGASYQYSDYGRGVSVNTGTTGLIYPNEFFFQNVPQNVQIQSSFSSTIEKQALFGNVTIGFRNMLFLDVSGRNDWASTLAGTDNESYFYPAVGLTAIVSEMITMPQFISFSKLRVSYTQVGNEVPFNRIFPQHGITAAGGVARNTQMPFGTLVPEMLTSTEFGADFRLFNGRAGFDFTYYNINSKDQFIQLPAPSGSGFTQYFVNAGEIVNKGIELSVDVFPVRTSRLTWHTTFNYSHNNNEVVETHPDLTSPISTGISEGYDSKFERGGSIGDIYVHKFLRDDQGRIILSPETGAPLKTQLTEYVGNLDPEWLLGWNNSFSIGNFGLNFLINSKVGGKAVSQTEAILDGYGVSKRSGEARDNGGVVKVNAVRDGVPVSEVDARLWYTTTGDRNGIKEYYTYDRTNVRLSQMALSYTFDMATINLPVESITLSAVGHNLFFIYKEAPFDPDMAMNTTRNYQSLDNFNLPSTRRIGFNLNLTF